MIQIDRWCVSWARCAELVRKVRNCAYLHAHEYEWGYHCRSSTVSKGHEIPQFILHVSYIPYHSIRIELCARYRNEVHFWLHGAGGGSVDRYSWQKYWIQNMISYSLYNRVEEVLETLQLIAVHRDYIVQWHKALLKSHYCDLKFTGFHQVFTASTIPWKITLIKSSLESWRLFSRLPTAVVTISVLNWKHRRTMVFDKSSDLSICQYVWRFLEIERWQCRNSFHIIRIIKH